MSSPSNKLYRPPNVPDAFYTNQLYGSVGVQIALVIYGVATVLFTQCCMAHIHSFMSPSSSSFPNFMRALKGASLSRKLQLAYIFTLFACGTIGIVADTWANIVATLDYPLYPGGSYMWAITHFNEPIFMLGQVPFQMTTSLADGFMLYRCYIVYTMTTGAQFILILPALLYLAAIGTGVALMVQCKLPLLSIFNLVNLSLANFSITASLNLIITALIAIRLVLHSISMRRLLGTDDGSMHMYTSLSSILIESSALFTLFSLVLIVTYAIDHPASKMFLPILGQIQVVAPLLVSLRISKKIAWTTKTWRSVVGGARSSVQFENYRGETLRVGDIETHLSFASRAQAGSTSSSRSGLEGLQCTTPEKGSV